jgi:hypothetical protein
LLAARAPEFPESTPLNPLLRVPEELRAPLAAVLPRAFDPPN